MSISQQRIKSINIVKLKQLKNIECSFEGNNLTAILGINGCGKSTILHALACCYQPQTDIGKDYKFNHNVEIEKYILKDECEKILKDFFKNLRERKKNIGEKGVN